VTQSRSSASPRSRPRPWHHDYLHLRSIAFDLGSRLAASGALGRVLDLGSGAAPYRPLFGGTVDQYVTVDADAAAGSTVVARAESLPFRDGVFDAVLSTQLLGLVQDPQIVAAEIERALRPGGRLWLTCPAAWPYDSARCEHRFGEPQLRELFRGLDVVEIVPQGGLLALPFALANQVAREAAVAAWKRSAALGALVRAVAMPCYLLANGAGRLLERLAEFRWLRPFLGYLDRRLPMNFLVVAEKPPARREAGR
jgi:SAM-dependent methyltransferase